MRTFVPPFSGHAVLYLRLKKSGGTPALSEISAGEYVRSEADQHKSTFQLSVSYHSQDLIASLFRLRLDNHQNTGMVSEMVFGGSKVTGWRVLGLGIP